MSFKEINLKNCYESGKDDIIEVFYEPVLSESRSYDRISGFFSSSSMAIVSRGLSTFIVNGGKMRLITSPRLNKDDAEVVRKFTEAPQTLNATDLGIDLNHIEDSFTKNHVKAFGWMLTERLLEIKLAIVVDDKGAFDATNTEKGLFHQKVGIFTDREGNELSFSGSINESASAWVNNDEEFKVFKAWEPSHIYYKEDKERFKDIWENRRDNIKVFDLPAAVREDIITYSKDFDKESISIKKYNEFKKNKSSDKLEISLFDYQKNALKAWKYNGYSLLFEMATGTGKTRTAIAGIKHLFDTNEYLFVIISTPQNTLSKQWKSEVEKLSLMVADEKIIDGTNSRWRNDLRRMLLRNGAGIAKHSVIYTTHSTASSEDFVFIITEFCSKRTKVLFIGDEVHWLGASELRKALLPMYKYRIGLSATPSRWFDDEGTKLLVDYFGNNKFEFSIRDALTTINPLTGKYFLVNYQYLIDVVSLTEDETNEYRQITAQLVRIASYKDKDDVSANNYQRLLERRANIIKNAFNKYAVFEKIIDKLSFEEKINNLLIFVSPEQLEIVSSILLKKGIVFHRLTQHEGTKPESRYGNISEREHIIKQFKSNDYQAIVAIKCLDEGIDIPCASHGILLSSSTNPREYIQRIGRIIRQDEGKSFAYLYDIAVSSISGLDDEEQKIERSIKNKEIIRLEEIAGNAINSVDALRIILSLKK